MRYLATLAGIDVNCEDHHGWVPLHYAIEGEGRVEALLAIMDVDVDPRYENGRTPLSYAASCNKHGIARMLLDTGKVDADSKDRTSFTPLAYAAFYEQR